MTSLEIIKWVVPILVTIAIFLWIERTKRRERNAKMKTTLIVKLKKSDNKDVFEVLNIGPSLAREINLCFKDCDVKNWPLVDKEADNLPVAGLHPNQSFKLRANIFSGMEDCEPPWDIIVAWQNLDDTPVKSPQNIPFPP
jgi:hypothetical protein